VRVLRRALLPGVCLIAIACARERSAAPRNVLRSESRSITLPSDPAALAVELAVPVDSLRAAGEERYGRQAYDSAQAIWRVELSHAVKAKNAAAEARVRMWLGLAAWKLGDYLTARSEGEVSLAMKRRLGLDGELSRSFNALGLLAWNEGRHRDALTQFDSAIASARRNHDAPGVARATGNIPLVKVELGDFDGARKGFEQAIAAGRAVDDDRTQGNALANLAMLEIRLGNPVSSLPLLADARSHYSKIEYATGEANALGQLATAWSELGDLQRAISLADSALTIARAQGLQQEIASILEVIADFHVQAGSLRLALQYLHEADSLDRKLGLAVESGTNLRRTAGILVELGEVPAAVARSREAITVHQGVEAKGEEVYDRIQLAQALSRNGELTSAAKEAEVALRLAVRVDNPSAVRDAALAAARIALDEKLPAKALDVLARTVPRGSSTDWHTADLKAESFLALGRLDDARREGEKAIAGLERERASLGVGQLRSEYFEGRVAPISRLVAIHLARHDTASAFRIAASLPGRSLAERIGGMTTTGGIAAQVADRERLLLRASVLEDQISKIEASPGASDQRAILERALESTRTEYEERLARQARAPSAAVLAQISINLSDIQSRLASDEALLSFLVGPDRTDVFVVRADGVSYHSVAMGDRALAARIRIARIATSGSSYNSSIPKALGDIHELLLRPLIDAGAFRGASRLLVVPHQGLGALPFAALWDNHAAKFLVEQYTLSYLPAVGALKSAATATRTNTRTMVVAPLPDSLPGTASEARAVARLALNSLLRIGPVANETAVRSALRAGWSVHIASHGSHNAQNPMFSRVLVGPGGGAASGNDGRLEVHEILGLSTSSLLVFLSGCETGLGSAGDGPFIITSDEGSLAQAFLFAGARNVVATLWRVNDAGAVMIAESFYRYLRNGLTAEEALSRSQRDAIRRRGDYTWAAYAIWGTPAPPSPLR
jgi:CHAT domain-containing protein